MDGRQFRLPSAPIHSIFSRRPISVGPRRSTNHWDARRQCRHLGWGPLALWLLLWPSSDLVPVFVFSGRWVDALLPQVSGGPDHCPSVSIVSILRLPGVDQLFRLGHSRVSSSGSGTSPAVQGTSGPSQSPSGNRGAFVRLLPASFFSDSRGTY